MDSTVLTIPGTLHADGTLELDQAPGLPPGRVEVSLHVIGAPPAVARGGLAETIERIKQDQTARGYKGLTAEELEERLAERIDSPFCPSTLDPRPATA